MVIDHEKHLNIAYVAQSEETSWKTWHRQGQMTQIVFVFEDWIEFEVAAECLNWDLPSC
jgi:hypothetical protein